MHVENEDMRLEMQRNKEKDIEPIVIEAKKSFKGSPFKSKVREIYYSLLSLNVGVKNIGDVIKTVLKFLNVEIDYLPSIKTVRNFNTELGIIAKNQINETVKNSKNITLHRDATTKKGRHYYGIEISTEGETLTAGVREVHNGTADTYVNSLNEIIEDISLCSGESSRQFFYENIQNSMTDRCATESKVNKILNENMSQNLNEFKCSTHPLLQFSEVCEKEISVLEKEFQKDFKIDSQSSFSNVLKSVSKLFFKDGTGDPLLASNYIKSKGIKNIPLINFRGNRFNIAFYNSAGVYFLKQHLLSYLKDSKTSLNYVQTVIVKCLENNFFLSILRAMGILSKIVTEPYFRFSSDKDNTILEMDGLCNRLVDLLSTAKQNPHLLLCNSISLLYGPCVRQSNEICECLFLPSDSLDSLTSIVLARLCKVLHAKCEHIFKDYLKHGKYYSTSEDITKQAKTCPTNNITVERLMAKVDSNLRNSPNIDIPNLESRVMYKKNETESWLSKKSESEQEFVVQSAVKLRKDVQVENRERKNQLFQKSIQIIEDRKRKKENTEIKKEKKNKKCYKITLLNLVL
ncbi:uncharacterized protein LOC128551786 [Mercenaria mercenaria]|uniref:uncharacterized protein LOC128551786 n=1 Tax=Mercenaria mercenaria TaxID=6596 RepID=UPI00234F118B|nr:uncharacterized protein LOC128551786 [Mercenaria mercenaria]